MPFKKAGLQIFGIDGSKEMLDVCRSKNITTELKEFDLLQTSLPYQDSSFNHIIANGLFHLTSEIEHLFSESSRLIAGNGIFAFTFDEKKSVENDGYVPHISQGIFEKTNEESGITAYKHTGNYIQKLLNRNNFILIKKLEFLAFKDPQKDWYFQAYLTRKQK